MRTPFLPLVFLLSIAGLAPAQDRKPLSPAETKAAFLKMLDRAKVEPDLRRSKDDEVAFGMRYERFTFASEKKADGTVERVPVLLVRPEETPPKPRPAVVVLHGTGGNKDTVKSWLEEFARRGLIGVAIDARYHGDRVGGTLGSGAYVAAVAKAWKAPVGGPMEHPFYYDTCWDLWRLLDVLEATPLVDKGRFGMVGISMGGIQTWLAASVDNRVTVAAPLIAVQSFRWSLDNDRWQGRAATIRAAHEAAAKDLGEPAVNRRVCRELWNKVVPGILTDFDCPNMLPLFAGRALFAANGELDPNCPIEGARLAAAAAREAFAAAGAKDKFAFEVAPGVPHRVTPEHRAKAIDFTVKHLTE